MPTESTDAARPLTAARYASLLRDVQRRDYRRCPKDTLTWAHYRVLLDRPNAELRAHYRELALQGELSVRQLLHRIDQDQRSGTATEAMPVSRPTQPSYLYGATVTNIVDGDTLDLRIDLGFHTDRRGRFRIADIDCPSR